MNNPKITIIVPVYNAEKYVRETLDSLKSQTMKDFEVLMIDDGSPDGSPAILDEYAQADSRFRVIHKENGGVSSARNLGLREAKGEWLIFVDADDLLPQNALEALYAAVDDETDYVLGSVIKFGDVPEELIEIPVETKTKAVLARVLNPAPWGQLFRKSVIDANHLVFLEDLAYSEDSLFVYTFRHHIRQLALVKTPVYRYRICSDSATFSPNMMKRATHHLRAAYYFHRLVTAQADQQAAEMLSSVRNHILGFAVSEMLQAQNRDEVEAAMRQQYADTFIKEGISMGDFDSLVNTVKASLS